MSDEEGEERVSIRMWGEEDDSTRVRSALALYTVV